MKSPYVYFGGKSRVAGMVWERLGDTPNFVEPFFGSGAVTLARPHYPFSSTRTETINDADGLVSNFWRSIIHSPEDTAEYADWPASENDLHARHVWLRSAMQGLPSRLEADPDYHDSKIAGWWVWGMACWIGSGWCGEAGVGPWVVEEREGNPTFVRLPTGRGVKRKRLHLGDAGNGVMKGDIYTWFADLADRMRNVRVACGDWSRVCGPSVTFKHGLTGIFFDPPYDSDMRDPEVYNTDRVGVSREVLSYCIENGSNHLLRIALCGYDGEHNLLSDKYGWDCVAWKAGGGFGCQGKNVDTGKENAKRERIWFSPHCLKPNQQTLF